MSKILPFFVVYLLLQISSYSQICVRADAGPDQTFCNNNLTTVIGTPAVSGTSYSWQPASIFNSPYTAQPIATINGTTTCTLTTRSNNLIINGDFESGFTGFSTDYGTFPNGVGCPQGGVFGSVAVTTNPSLLRPGFCNMPSHPPIGDKMLWVDGTCAAGLRVWYQTVTVTPNTTYYFSAWESPGSSGYNRPARIRVTINGTNIIQNTNNNDNCNSWFELAASWNSGNSTTAQIVIWNDNRAYDGNDCCLDDIHFSDCVSTDQVTVFTGQGANPTISPSGPITYYNQFETSQNLTLTSSPMPSYQWYKNGIAIPGATSQTYNINMVGYQKYSDYYSVAVPCGRGLYSVSRAVQFNYRGCMYDYEYPPSSLVQYPCQSSVLSPNYLQLPSSSTQPGWSTIWILLGDQLYGPGASPFTINSSGQLTQPNPTPAGYGISEAIYTKSYLGGQEIWMYYGFSSNSSCRTANSMTTSSIYPNPSISNSEVTIKSTENVLRVELLDAFAGTVVKQIKGNKSKSLRIPISGLKEGVYTCRVITSKQVDNLKLMIKN